MAKFHQFLTELSALDMIMAGYYCFMFLLGCVFRLHGEVGVEEGKVSQAMVLVPTNPLTPKTTSLTSKEN